MTTGELETEGQVTRRKQTKETKAAIMDFFSLYLPNTHLSTEFRRQFFSNEQTKYNNNKVFLNPEQSHRQLDENETNSESEKITYANLM